MVCAEGLGSIRFQFMIILLPVSPVNIFSHFSVFDAKNTFSFPTFRVITLHLPVMADIILGLSTSIQYFKFARGSDCVMCLTAPGNAVSAKSASHGWIMV